MAWLGTRLYKGLYITLLMALVALTVWAFTAYQAPSFAFGLANLLTLCGF
jgi:hypothetical protein